MAKHYVPAFEKGMTDARTEVDAILKNNKEPDFDNTILALDKYGALLTKISAVFFNQGFETVEYLAASMLDMSYHTLEAPAIVDVQKFEKEYLHKIGLIPEIISRYRTTYFIHITVNGYDSGYYSYIWAAVLDNDAFEAFKEKGLFDQATASSFRKNILEKNGTMDAMQMFVNFRGREPVIELLLKSRGLN